MSETEKLYSGSKRRQMSDAVAMGTISSIYWMVHDHNNAPYNGEYDGEDFNINFILGDGVITAQVESYWSGETNSGEARCDDGNRVCALVRAVQDHDTHNTLFEKEVPNYDINEEYPPIHCGCLGERENPVLTAIGFEQIFNLTECILKAEFDTPVDSFC